MERNLSSIGVLILVSTPIGNLQDMTLRGLQTLQEADMVLAEDSRRTRKLFSCYHIKNKIISYHDFNKEKVTPGILEKLRAGSKIALVTDAGTPGISDPGFYLVRRAKEEGIPVTINPGASSVISALVVSGFPTDSFVFAGYMPRKASEIGKRIKELGEEKRTVIFFVSPHRLKKTLEQISGILPERRLALVRELTKVHEEVIVGTSSDLLKSFKDRAVKGEMVLLVEGVRKRG